MLRKLLLAAGAALLAVSPSLAWNRAGHMAMAAMAYDELRQRAPSTVAQVLAILLQHPQYESRWKPQIAGLSPQDQERYLFMLAARWPDDVRGDSAFDHPSWHYINYPYKPSGQPPSVSAPPPAGENIVEAFQRNVAVVQSAAADAEKAVALCWIFHLVGDSHQPLHTVALFTTQFPSGDRGGNLIFIKAAVSSSRTENLHAYWDNIILMDDQYSPASGRARALAAQHPRLSMGELAEPRFEMWARNESLKLAISDVYRKGKLKGGADQDHGIPLPQDYPSKAKRVAERRLALSAYRLADLLRATFH